MTGVEPLEEIEAFGKGGKKDQPVSVRGKRGNYFYIRAEHYEQLQEINETYRKTGRTEVEPLKKITVIGRGGTEGYRPFILPNYPNRYLCIPANQLQQLEKVNDAYRDFLEEEKRREK